MIEFEFRGFLEGLGYEGGTPASIKSIAVQAEKILTATPPFLGMSFADIVATDTCMHDALDALQNMGISGVSVKMNALRLYYCFRNGAWYDNWRPAIAPVARAAACVSHIPVSIGTVISDCPPVYYASNVKPSEILPGLTGFLGQEFFRIRQTEGGFIFGNDVIRALHESGSFPVIPVILSSKCPKKTYHESDEYIAQRIAGLSKNYQGLELEAAIIEMLNNRDFTESILGRYCHSGCPDYILAQQDMQYDRFFRFSDNEIPYIELYYRNTDTPDPDEYMALFANCLAHEYLHFLNDLYAGPEFQNKSAKATAVKEALADFFSVMYSLYRYDVTGHTDVASKNLAKKRYDLWASRFGSSWPYANALYFFDGGRVTYNDDWHILRSDCSDKYNAVFKECQKKMTRAYNELVK